MTVLDALIVHIRKAGDHNRAAEVAPAVILWPDRERQWEALLPALRVAMPELYTYGNFVPEQRSGPAIYLRCILGGTIPQAPIGKGVPVLYLPGVGRADLRAVESCPRLLQPLAELQYRGSFFGHSNGKDWTTSAFLSSGREGLGLDLAEDQATLTALRQVLRRLAEVHLEDLRGRRLEASDFHDLLSSDFDRDLLRWMNHPESVKAEYEGSEWAGFCSRTFKRYGFHPESDGALVAAEHLVRPDLVWKTVWARFDDSPTSYPNVIKLLSRVSPSIMHPHTSPTVASNKEDALRADLLTLSTMTQSQATVKLQKLEAEHGPRRAHVWARLGKTPLVKALEHLATISGMVGAGAGSGSPEAIAARYSEGGWCIDRAAIRALSFVEGKDAEAIHVALIALYRPWLEEQASALSTAVSTHGYPRPDNLSAPVDGECILFADGLRMDVGRWLAESLAKEGIKVTTNTRWVAFPPVTPTAKPAASPVAGLLAGSALNEDFRPAITATGKLLTQDLFKKLLSESGVQFLDPTDTGKPAGCGWTEFGDIDTYGHQHGWKTARHIESQIQDLVRRIEELFAAGWQRVRVVTDHGWLLLPGSLPKRDIHASLTNTRWRRCATLKAGVTSSVQTVPWHWNKDVDIAIAPGIGIFVDGADYSHGGLTVQECVVPVLVVEAPKAKISVEIAFKWRGLQCKVSVKAAPEGAWVDLRSKAGDPSTSVALEVKLLSGAGQAQVAARDDAEGQATSVVVLDASGKVLARQATTVGGEG